MDNVRRLLFAENSAFSCMAAAAGIRVKLQCDAIKRQEQTKKKKKKTKRKRNTIAWSPLRRNSFPVLPSKSKIIL